MKTVDALLAAGLAVDAVVAGAGAARFELAEGVAVDDPVELGVAERPDRRLVRAGSSSFAPAPGPLDDGGQRGRLAGQQRPR